MLKRLKHGETDIEKEGPNTEQLKEEMLPWRPRARLTKGLENEKEQED